MSNLPIPPTVARIAPDGNLTPRQRRRLMIDMLVRRIRPGTGSSIEFLQRRTALIPWPDLRPILQGIPWVLIGGIAMRAYMAERETKAMDVLVYHVDRDEVMHRFKTANFKAISSVRPTRCLLHSPEGVEINLHFGIHPWIQEALKQPAQDMVGYPVIALPYLVLMKLTAQHAQDWADVSRMLGWAADDDLDAVRSVVARYSPEDLEDLETLIFLGRQEREIPPLDEEEDTLPNLLLK